MKPMYASQRLKPDLPILHPSSMSRTIPPSVYFLGTPEAVLDDFLNSRVSVSLSSPALLLFFFAPVPVLLAEVELVGVASLEALSVFKKLLVAIGVGAVWTGVEVDEGAGDSYKALG